MRHLRAVVTASALALASVSAIAHASEFDDASEDDNLRADACGAIACHDGSHECARINVTRRSYLWLPIFPTNAPIPIPIDMQTNFTCYEAPQK